MINVSVIGATGYVGAELLRLLSAHPGVQINKAVSKSFAGKKLHDIYANFLPERELELQESGGKFGADDFVFLCLPHGQSLVAAPPLLKKGHKVIDLSGDFRYDNTDIYEKWYGISHSAKKENREAVYGLPEFFGAEVKKANFISNPGCYTTTSILALAPLLKEGLICEKGIVIDAKSGVTGAGRKEKLAFSYCETAGNFKAYSVPLHRHTSEIEEQLSKLSRKDVCLLFTPHLLPVKRGILATVYADLMEGVTPETVTAAYEKYYADAPFTHVLPHGKLPELKYVVGSNNCMIGFEVSPRTGKIIVVSCTDNLIKGAAGQAVQNFNLMNGFDETLGLPRTAWYL
ncbi:N-acetyl-gamma-glutamyl-phosphate reductase [Christensenella minuta]|uniref:N-acetyl-gamma-glutamyl-phosphate reductase n=1 Tax=Christensenella minuta TaxID=626937 RepID=UPI002A807989|nr:N-acetyl-gamma-glutamyl-phosphate reductase [Christensenella minuta]MDY3751663.1 N-acetyl-gamma-glutamyl-phosphate reductase [Christensenella minuta]